MSYAFCRKQRLLQPSEFNFVFTQANYKATNKVLLLLVRENNGQIARLGLVIAKKNIKLAVQRNRVKRQIREFFRVQQKQLQGLDLVFVAKKCLGKLNNQQVKQNIAGLIDKIQQQRLKA